MKKQIKTCPKCFADLPPSHPLRKQDKFDRFHIKRKNRMIVTPGS